MKQVIYFGAEWCGPCQQIKPQLRAAGLPIQYIDVDQNREITERYGIRNVPTVILLQNGEITDRKTGNMITVSAVKQMLNL